MASALMKNTGALKEYLTDIAISPTYNKFKDDVRNLVGKLPVGKKTLRVRWRISSLRAEE